MTATATAVALVVPTDALTDAVSYAAKAVAKAQRPEHKCVAISATAGKLVVRGTDTTWHRSMTLDVDTDGFDEVALPADKITKIVSKAKADTVRLELDADGVKVSAGRRSYTLRTLSASDLPPVPEIGDGAVEVSMAAEAFADIVRRVVKVTSDDVTQAISAVQLACNGKALRAAGTDTYRLAYAVGPISAGDNAQALVPPAELGEMAAAAARTGGDLTLSFGPRRLAMQVGAHVETVTHREGAFPDFVQILDIEGETRIKIADTAGFREEVDAAAITAVSGAIGPVLSFVFDDEEATASSGQTETGEGDVDLPCTVEGKAVTARFTGQFLNEGLSLAGDRQVVWHIVDPLKPSLIDGGVVDGIAFKYLLMPTRG